MKFYVNFEESTTAIVLARMTAADASGAPTGVVGEGRWLQQADIDSISCAVYDLDGAGAAVTPIATPTVDINSVLDVPVTTTELWSLGDGIGYNFQHTLDAANFPTGGHRYLVKYTVSVNGGETFYGVWEGPVADPTEE